MASADGIPVDIKPRSRDVTDGPQRAPARSMLRAVGLTDDDWAKMLAAHVHMGTKNLDNNMVR